MSDHGDTPVPDYTWGEIETNGEDFTCHVVVHVPMKMQAHIPAEHGTPTTEELHRLLAPHVEADLRAFIRELRTVWEIVEGEG
jgi:hypothetical protein